jgi:hypothetical protein
MLAVTAVLSFVCLTPAIHELGHVIIAIVSNYSILQVQILPFPLHSFVVVSTPLNADLTLFWLMGTWFCIINGAIIGFLIPYFKYRWLGLGVSGGLSCDGIIEPLVALFGKSSDLAMVSYNWGLLTFCISILLILGAITMYLKTMRGATVV